MQKEIALKREKEKKVVSEMIRIYCKGFHNSKGRLCDECKALRDYAAARSDTCPLMENKTFCSNCTVHCYEPEMRSKIKTVMRYAGPRMLLHHPVMAIKHVIAAKREKEKL